MYKSQILNVSRKELWSFFSSPTAFIFLGSYLAASLFTFFFVEKFFSRNIADLKPLFEWMPILMIFLCSTLTMKMWSEERKMGTVEFLLTLPIKTSELVLGKFLACLAMVAIALTLTLGLAFTASLLGPLDWGPTIGAYFASLLLASAYLSIGLYVSSKTDNQIVSLTVTAAICSLFYLLGSETLLQLAGNTEAEALRFLGSSSHFVAISRGILDVQDIYYYLSLTLVFLVANTFSLDRSKWSTEAAKPTYTQQKLTIGLLVLNLVGANFWLHYASGLRVDMTRDRMYSISDATKNVVSQLGEPLLIRGYFSERTHPLLAPLVPTLKDLLTEFKNVSQGRINVEFVDPRENEDLEAEANRKYNIEPVPFQVSDRHSASMINSYFNIVIEYGDQHVVLGFNDLIEVQTDGFSKIDVELRNPEYELTRSIAKVMRTFNTTDNVFASIDSNVTFVGYVSEGTIPEQLQTLFSEIKTSLQEYAQKSDGKFSFEFKDPTQDSQLAEDIMQNYGFAPQSLSLFSKSSFYFYLTLQDGDRMFQIGIPEDLDVSGFNDNLETTLKRLIPGFLRTAGIVAPPAPPMNPMMAQFGPPPSGKQFRTLKAKLDENFNTEEVDLSNGIVPSNVDALVVLAPKDLTDKQIFAIDQFLMKGGTVIMATSPIGITREQRGFRSETYKSGLNEWLGHHGVEVKSQLVMDKRSGGYPSLRERVVQGITIKEPYLTQYPLFVDVRQDGLNQDNMISSRLGEINMAWTSPVTVDESKQTDRTVTTLLTSSDESWTTTDQNVQPNHTVYPELGFEVGSDYSQSTLATMIEGKFDSFFAGKESPLLDSTSTDAAADASTSADGDAEKTSVVTSVISKSPTSARLVVIGSNEFVADETLQIAGMVRGSQYLNSLQLIENTLDWSTSERDLLAIRSRGHFARTLAPLTDEQKQTWEFGNYVVALIGLMLVFGVYRTSRRRSQNAYKELQLA